MLERIPQRIDHYRYTDKGVILDGVIVLEESEKDLSRLNEAIVKGAGDIKYHLEFDTDRFSNRIVNGVVKTQVILKCQRCLNDFALDLKCDISIAFVHNDFEAKSAEEAGYENFWLEKKELLDPRLLIEEELLLALPQIAMHPDSDVGINKSCQVQLEYPVIEGAQEASELNPGVAVTDSVNKDSEQMDKNNPFAVLKQLKK